MKEYTEKFKIRLGIFILGGLGLFVLGIFIIGKQKNIFDPVVRLKTVFYNVSGLQIGNNVRFSGINIGTIDKIAIISDSSVMVEMIIKKSVAHFIKADCQASIGSEGLIGDKLLTISPGSTPSPLAKDGQQLRSIEPLETDAIIASLELTASNAAIISDQLAAITQKINSGRGTLGRLIQDTTIGEDFQRTMLNLRQSSNGLNQNMKAASESVLLRAYFKRKAKAAEKAKARAKKNNKE